MGTTALAAAMIFSSLAGTSTGLAQAFLPRKGPTRGIDPTSAEARRRLALQQAAEQRRTRGRASTLTQAGGLGEQPTLGRPSLLGGSARAGSPGITGA